MKINSLLLKQDLRRYAPVAALALGLWALIRLLTGQICSLVLLTGLPCPWCGLTRALLALLRLDVAASLQAHPLLAGYGVLAVLAFFWRYGSLPRLPVLIWGIVLVLLTLAVYALRMLTLFPTVAPMTYDPRNLLAWFQSILEKGVTP